MNYVMEVGPLSEGRWLAFTLDSHGQTHMASADDRETVLKDMVAHLAGKPARCAPSLHEFGRAHGWKRGDPTRRVLELAAILATSHENLGSLEGLFPAPQLVDVFLRSCVAFLSRGPWSQPAPRRVLDVHYDSGAGVEERRGMLISGPEETTLLIARDPEFPLSIDMKAIPPECLAIQFVLEPEAAAQTIVSAHHRRFVPLFTRFHRSETTRFKDYDLLLAAAALSSVASLYSARDVGRSKILSIETFVTPRDVSGAKQLAS
ncbi:MAG: hypothetical protein JNM17_16300 [Archangium sp.]|nr:hypothetical protein [Archangium sp.]